ncbi:FUSC family protein [Streptomyces sp. I05A-00742]|uniref:FUSC family protein n=1 Tax=Streptomyces sp. I05A-00742 TaxID=2732853 RepID=UPI001487C7DC|nr:FUSC family protein [Streptomyces sp. I05A-00742]
MTRRPARSGFPGLAKALAALLRPEGRPRYADGLAAGAALTVPLVVGTATGHPGTGAAVALPAVLLAMPFPAGADRAERARCLAVRGAWTTAAGAYTALAGHGVLALALGVGFTAFAGAMLRRVGATAALAVLLTGITGVDGTPTEGLPVPGLAQLVGCVWTAALLLPRRRRASAAGDRARPDPPPPARDPAGPPEPPKPPTPPAPPPPNTARLRHAARLAVLTGTAAAVTGIQGTLWGEGHWLVTSLLLTLRPTREETGVKFAKRLIGNSLGGVAAALLLLCHPGPYTVAALVGASGAAAYAFRPANYAYWALASPTLLLLLSDFDEPVPWYATVVRVALNLAGGCVALLATRWLWPAPRADGGRGGARHPD